MAPSTTLVLKFITFGTFASANIQSNERKVFVALSSLCSQVYLLHCSSVKITYIVHGCRSLLNQLREPLTEGNYNKQNEVADQLAKYRYRMHDNMIHFTVSPLFVRALKEEKLGINYYSSTTVCNESKSLSLSVTVLHLFLRAHKTLRYLWY